MLYKKVQPEVKLVALLHLMFGRKMRRQAGEQASSPHPPSSPPPPFDAHPSCPQHTLKSWCTLEGTGPESIYTAFLKSSQFHLQAGLAGENQQREN
eukprot:1140990-Pelagomonas_calceolata.AAC.2